MDSWDFEQIVNAWYDPLYRFALSLARNPDDARDLTQTAFARYAEKGRNIKDPQKAKSWLFTVLYREFVSRHRRDRRLVFDGDAAADEAFHDGEQHAATRVDCAAALEALVGLDEIFRAPLTLFYLQELSYREIAGVLNLPIGTVMSRLARGRQLLRRVLERAHDEKIVQFDDRRAGRRYS